jgi:molecular chaperone DnaK (HSP70)
MVRESVDHAFEDMEARRFIEAAQKAERVMASTRSALKLLASRLEPAEVARIEADLRVLEEALQGKVAEPVRNAIRQLDESTARLADLLMEEEVDKALGDKRMP